MIDDPKPLPPEILADGLQDKIHEDKGKVRAATSHKFVELKRCPACGGMAPVEQHCVRVLVQTHARAHPESEEVARLRAQIEQLKQEKLQLWEAYAAGVWPPKP